MSKRILLFVLLFAALPGFSRDKAETWIEVRSEHFIVNTNSNEKQARKIAGQFERMRSMFHAEFPKMQIDPPSPVIVLAIRDEKDFRALEPEEYLRKGQLKLGGLFLRAPDKNYVLMRIDAEGDHPYEVVYHEYTHLVLAKDAEWLPLWLNEGLAQFYETTSIHDKEVDIGQASQQNIMLLRQQSILPLATLFKVDQQSPYYHEENKGSIFYAESWALMHMLIIKDGHEKTHHISEYEQSLARGTDPIAAATTSFGDLRQLEDALRKYVQQPAFYFAKEPLVTEVDESTFKAQALTGSQSDALRADFLAYNRRIPEANALLGQVLQEDPNNVSAHETMGYLAFRDGRLEEAKKWYGQAVQLDSQSYLARYYFAAISMNGKMAPGDEARVEASLRSGIKLNPSFAPTYDRLAVFLTTHHGDLQEAHMMGLQAISLEPANVGYRMNVANVLLQMHQSKNAINVLRLAEKLAKSPEEVQQVENFLMHAQEYDAELDAVAEQQRQMAEVAKADNARPESTAEVSDGAVPNLKHRDTFVAKGPHRFLVGVLKSVHCSTSQIDLTVDSGAKTLPLHAENYYKLQFSALNFTPSGDLNPCKDLEGRPAKVEYVESADPSIPAHVLSVELHK
jgi:tetratricopeptide (TPR) repeat protein